MNIVYPVNGHKTFEDSTFLMGSTDKGTTVELNESVVSVSEHGSFCHPVILKPGENHFKLTASNGKIAEVTVIREPDFSVLQESPLVIAPETILPDGDIALMPGNTVRFACLASPGAKVEVELAGLFEDKVLLSQVSQDQAWIDNRVVIFAEHHQTVARIPTQGYTVADVQLPLDCPNAESVSIRFHLSGDNEKPFVFDAPAKLSIWHQPRTGTIKKDRAVVRYGPSTEAARLAPLPKGTIVKVDGRVGDWYRLLYRDNLHIWTHQDNIEVSDLYHQPKAVVSTMRMLEDANRQAHLYIPMSAATPFHIASDENCLRLQLFQAVSHHNFIQEVIDGATIVSIQTEVPNDNQVDIVLNVPRLSGYDYQRDAHGLSLKVKALPRNLDEVVILIDPGHGGDELGSVGPSGLPEKDLNLTVSRWLSDALKVEGFQQVHQTRHEDVDVSLEARSQKAREVNADIVLSLHHNALPDGRDPRRYEGACMFYYHLFSKSLAVLLQDGVTNGLSVPDFGILYDSLYMTRIHTGISVLLEYGFFTNPKEFDRLCDPLFQQQAAQVLARVLRNYCLNEYQDPKTLLVST